MTILHNGRPLDEDEVCDLLDSIPELHAEIARYKRVLRSIAALCNTPHWSADRRWKIEALASESAELPK